MTAPPELPRIIPASDVVPLITEAMDGLRAVRKRLVNDINPGVACSSNVMQPLMDANNSAQGVIEGVAMLRFASPDKAARDASYEALRIMSKYDAEAMGDGQLYDLLKAVQDKAEPVDDESKRYLDELIKDYQRAGYGTLKGDNVVKYLEARNEIDALRREFNRNIMDDDGGIWFTEKQLHGVPAASLGQMPSRDGQSTTEYFVKFSKGSVQPVMKHATNPATRKTLYVSQYKRLEANVGIFKDVIVRRDSNARMLGYPSHAAFRLARRMAKTPEWVHSLLTRLQDLLVPKGRIEMDKLLASKRKYLANFPEHGEDPHPGIMAPWDLSFFTQRAEEGFGLDQEKVSEYFPLEHTLTTMLDIFSHCLQLRFQAVTPKPEQIWHEDVRVWSVCDRRAGHNDAFVGHLYMDVLARPNKYRGSQDVNLQASYLKPDGTRVYPATILMCAFPRETSTRCVLLKHRELVSVFHELGHGMHDLLSRTKHARFHGWRSPPDYAEGPSVMLENWCWMKDELRRMSRHYTTLDTKFADEWAKAHPGEPLPSATIPDDYLDRLVESRAHSRLMQLLDIVAVSRFDMAVHDVASHEKCLELDPTGLYNNMEHDIRLFTVPDPVDCGHPHVHFGHLLSGYDAGYYSYLSAEIIAADIFQTNFAKDPRDQAVWQQYREGVLQNGAGRDELDMLQEYLGRPLDPNPLLDNLGLS